MGIGVDVGFPISARNGGGSMSRVGPPEGQEEICMNSNDKGAGWMEEAQCDPAEQEQDQHEPSSQEPDFGVFLGSIIKMNDEREKREAIILLGKTLHNLSVATVGLAELVINNSSNPDEED
jgi:hypothetical protein